MGMIGTYVYNITRTAPSTTTLTMTTPKIERNQIIEVTSAYVGDYTTANKKVILGIRPAAGDDVYLPIDQGAETFFTHLNGQAFLFTGDCMVGIVESPTANDVCYFSVHGKRFKSLV